MKLFNFGFKSSSAKAPTVKAQPPALPPLPVRLTVSAVEVKEVPPTLPAPSLEQIHTNDLVDVRNAEKTAYEVEGQRILAAQAAAHAARLEKAKLVAQSNRVQALLDATDAAEVSLLDARASLASVLESARAQADSAFAELEDTREGIAAWETELLAKRVERRARLGL